MEYSGSCVFLQRCGNVGESERGSKDRWIIVEELRPRVVECTIMNARAAE